MSKYLESLKEKQKRLGYLSPVSNDVAEWVRHYTVQGEIKDEMERLLAEAVCPNCGHSTDPLWAEKVEHAQRLKDAEATQ